MANTVETWQNFFQSCDIPAEMGKKYANIFVKQRMKPDLLKDLAKEDLRDLGISALGDQLAIMRYVKLCDGSPPEFSDTPNAPGRKVISTGNDRRRRSLTFSDEDEPMPMDTVETFSKAPDRHDIYHIKMPEGNTKRSKNILEKHSELRDQGLIKRGVSGVRRAGVELHRVAPLSKSIQKRSPTKPGAIVVQDTDITSSSAIRGIIPLGTLRSDAISTKTSIVKDAILSPIRGGNSRMARHERPSALRVALDTPLVNRRLPLSQRELVNYRDGIEFLIDDGQRQPVSQQRKQKLPIAQRIRLVGSQFTSSIVRDTGNNEVIGNQKLNRRRPVITLGGQHIKLGPKKAQIRGAGGTGSILNRITIK